MGIAKAKIRIVLFRFWIHKHRSLKMCSDPRQEVHNKKLDCWNSWRPHATVAASRDHVTPWPLNASADVRQNCERELAQFHVTSATKNWCTQFHLYRSRETQFKKSALLNPMKYYREVQVSVALNRMKYGHSVIKLLSVTSPARQTVYVQYKHDIWPAANVQSHARITTFPWWQSDTSSRMVCSKLLLCLSVW
jgi:hypothetical protein